MGDASNEQKGMISVPTEKCSEIITAEHLNVKPKSFQSLFFAHPHSHPHIQLRRQKQMSMACSCSGYRLFPNQSPSQGVQQAFQVGTPHAGLTDRMQTVQMTESKCQSTCTMGISLRSTRKQSPSGIQAAHLGAAEDVGLSAYYRLTLEAEAQAGDETDISQILNSSQNKQAS